MNTKKKSSRAEELNFSENQVKATKKRSSRFAVEVKTKLEAETEKAIAVLITNLSLLALRLATPVIRCNINQTTVWQKLLTLRSPISHPKGCEHPHLRTAGIGYLAVDELLNRYY